jgi:hypothetical protein
MKRLVVMAVALTASIFLASDQVGGRGGRGGGGGGRSGGGFSGGAGRVGGGGVVDFGSGLGAGSVAQGGRPVGPGPGAGAGKVGGGRPSKADLGNFLDIGGPGGAGPGPGSGPSAVGDFFKQGPGASTAGPGKGIAKTPTPGGKPAQVSANRPNRVENRQQLAQQRQGRRQEIQNEFRDNCPRWDFAMDHPRWAQRRVNRPYRWATAAALTAWCGYGAGSYYDYGENIYYQDGAVYSDGQKIATAEEYAAAAEQIATNVPETKNPDWMPLGVFAITQDGQASGPTPTMFLQLNVSKEGIIAGAFQNTATNTTQPIEGMVDKQSQRAAWVISGKTRPLMEVGVFNLTKDSAPALLHFADGQTQQWLLVRLEESKVKE